jgi:hypothetical protein
MTLGERHELRSHGIMRYDGIRAALLDWVRTGVFDASGKIIFHTYDVAGYQDNAIEILLIPQISRYRSPTTLDFSLMALEPNTESTQPIPFPQQAQ